MGVGFFKCFLYICWNYCVMLFFFNFNIAYYIKWFLSFKPILHSWSKFHLVMLYNMFIYYKSQVAKINLRNFASMFMSIFGLSNFLVIIFLVWLSLMSSLTLVSSNSGLIEWMWNISSSSMFWKFLLGFDINS